MRNQKKIYIYIIISVIVMGFMIFSLVQMLGYANIINDAGIVRGGTQRLVKLELAHMPNNELSNYIDSLIKNLEKREDSRVYISSDSKTYQEDLAAVTEAWQLLKEDIQAYRNDGSTENDSKILSHSEEH
ncbi:MAG: GGDEF-domain containing protein, partial [Eubacterium sp.]